MYTHTCSALQKRNILDARNKSTYPVMQLPLCFMLSCRLRGIYRFLHPIQQSIVCWRRENRRQDRMVCHCLAIPVVENSNLCWFTVGPALEIPMWGNPGLTGRKGTLNTLSTFFQPKGPEIDRWPKHPSDALPLSQWSATTSKINLRSQKKTRLQTRDG